MDATIPTLVLAPLDSARVVSTVYSLSLVSLVPFAAAAIAAATVRRMSAGSRVLVWRAAIVTLLLIAGAQLVPMRWEAWVLPAALADPLIAIGREAMRSSALAKGGTADLVDAGKPLGSFVVPLIATIYLAGVAAVLSALAAAVVAAHRLVATSFALDDHRWVDAADEVRNELGIRRAVPLRTSSRVAVPMVVGAWRPVVLIPAALVGMPAGARRAVLLHELAHVRAADLAYAIGAQLACALLWFHPGAWWIARGLHRESEMACDDRVLAAGTRQSDYASLLANAAGGLAGPVGCCAAPPHSAASAFTGRGALRERLAAITSVTIDRRAPRRLASTLTLATAAAAAAPLGLVKLEPTRDVLQSLMQDDRWESRAFAALGLAPRPDSLSVTVHAATSDPSPRVRAWASYALARNAASHGALLQLPPRQD